MNTFNKLQAQAMEAIDSKNVTPKQILKGVAGLLDTMDSLKPKVDKGSTLTARDKQVRKALPKAKHELTCKQPKDQILNRILDNIQRVQKMAPNELDLHSQLWAVYAAVEAMHVEDDHWIIADLPQPKVLSPQLTDLYYLDRHGVPHRKLDPMPLIDQGATDYWTGDECNATKGNHHYGMQSGKWEAGESYKYSEIQS